MPDYDAYMAALIETGADGEPGADGLPSDDTWGAMQAILDDMATAGAGDGSEGAPPPGPAMDLPPLFAAGDKE